MTGPTIGQDAGPAAARRGGQLAGVLLAVHPAHTVLTGVGLGAAALVSGRPGREALVAGGAALVVQAVLGLDNDAVDEQRDRASDVRRKPVAAGRLAAADASFAAVCLGVLGVPLALLNGSAAAVALLGVLVAGLLYDHWLRRTPWSWVPWAVGFALYPAYLSYGGWGPGLHGGPPTWAMTAAAAALGVGVHLLTSLPDLVADHKGGVRHLPLRLALRTGATPLLVLASAYTVLAAAAVVVVGAQVGLHR